MKKPECRQADISITPETRSVSVFLNSKLILKTNNALALKEGAYPVVHYVPRVELEDPLIEPSTHHTYCPFKGYASYFNLEDAKNAVWYYHDPCPLVEQVKDHVAFWGDGIKIEVVD